MSVPFSRAAAADSPVLIVTNGGDTTADFLQQRLEERGVPAVRLNTEDVPHSASLKFSLASTGFGDAELQIGELTVHLNSVRSIWWRRPVPPRLLPEVPQEFRRYLVGETAASVDGILRTLHSLWVNHPDADAAAQFKPLQLAAARRLGLRTPSTLVTSSPADALEFIGRCDVLPIVKSLSRPLIERNDGMRLVAYARSIEPQDLAESETIRLSPVFLQERIPRLNEFRITIVGADLYATTIRPTDRGVDCVDWRSLPDSELEYAAAALPEDVELRCRQLVQHFGLAFTAMDLIETPTHEFVFLDLNSSGQWLWLELATGQPISNALVQLLSGEST